MKESNEHTTKKTGIARLLEIAGERRRLLTVAGALSVIATILMFIPYVLTYFIVKELIEHAANPAVMDLEFIRTCGVGAIVSLLSGFVVFYGSTMAAHISAFNILYNLRVRLTEHLAKLPMGYHTRQSTGSIKKTLELSVEKIENFIAHQLPDLVSAIALPVLMIAAMFVLDWRLALACAVPLVGAYTLQSMVFMGKDGQKLMKEYHNYIEKMNAEGVEYVRGMPAVKVFGLSVATFLRFHDSITNYRNFVVQYTKWCKRPYMMFVVTVTSLLAFILPVGLFAFSAQPDKQAFALTLMLFLVIAPGLSSPIMKLMMLGGSLRHISEGVERMDQIFSQTPVLEPTTPKTPQHFDIEFDHVRFSYQSQDEATRTDALTEISFTAKENEITALVGPSGSGKSTIANLIPRFWDVSAGCIRIGGIDIREMGTERLMDAVSFVFQDVHLFYDTIEENIRMGNTNATQDDVIAAAKAASCHEFIEKLPEGYATKIGEGGTYLSGGEAQRVAIARAILKNSPILVLDEATAFADPDNEMKIQHGLNALIGGKTVIVIAHRLSTIQEAEQIIVLNAGRIAETGTHKDLLRQNGLYKRMWDAHIDAETWTIAQ